MTIATISIAEKLVYMQILKKLGYIIFGILSLGTVAVAAQPSPEQTWGLCIGISRYNSEELSLKWAAKDAGDFCNFLQHTLEVPNDHRSLLQDEDATERAIRKELAWLMLSAKPNDRIYIFYSGHGKGDASPIVPYDQENAITREDIENFLSKSDAHDIIFFMDACYSGRLVQTGAKAFQIGNQLVAKGIPKNVPRSIARNSPGTIIVTSADGIQKAYESKELKNSIFTHHLTTVLEQEEPRKRVASKDPDGAKNELTLYEVYEYVREEMKKDSEQQPQITNLEKSKKIVLFQVASLQKPSNKFQDVLRYGNGRYRGPEMVKIPPGSFEIGDMKGYSNEKKIKYIRMNKTFAVGVYEVTFDEYDLFCKETERKKARDNGWGRGRRPVINVSWKDALAYTQWLSKQTGYKYRLLTEAEWEYIARAGTTTKYWWGDNIGENRAVCTDCTSGYGLEKEAAARTAIVGSFKENPYGVCDTVGNVWEWTCSQ